MKEYNALCEYIVNSLCTVYAIDERKQISDEEETATDPIYKEKNSTESIFSHEVVLVPF